jgi:CheY-like chemotaxis protein
VKTKLDILLVEDNAADAELIAGQLEAVARELNVRRVQTELEFRDALQAGPPDLIISDHGLPSFSGFKALEIVRAEHPTLPFIFVSGSNDQGMVAQMFDAGATDYVFKNDLHDLSPAVREALRPAPAPSAMAAPALPPPVDVAFVRLRLCPSCLQARNEQNATVDFLECFRSHKEIVVLHELCNSCRLDPRRNSS